MYVIHTVGELACHAERKEEEEEEEEKHKFCNRSKNMKPGDQDCGIEREKEEKKGRNEGRKKERRGERR